MFVHVYVHVGVSWLQCEWGSGSQCVGFFILVLNNFMHILTFPPELTIYGVMMVGCYPSHRLCCLDLRVRVIGGRAEKALTIQVVRIHIITVTVKL